MSKYTFLHFADIQYNVRNRHLNRKIEFEYVNHQLIERAKEVDAVLLSGDIFEHWDTNNVEEQLFIDLVNGMLQANSKLVIYAIDGNHDLKQKNVDFDNGSGTKEQYVGTLSKLSKAINNSRFVHFAESKLYPTVFNNVVIAAWDTNAKYTNREWSPWLNTQLTIEQIQQLRDKCFVIEMFHDCIANAVNFDGEIVKGDNDARLTTSAFFGHYVALGDIHMPSRVNYQYGVMSYPSSTAIRDFGEGDYIVNGKITQEGNNKHGYNIVSIDTDTKEVEFAWMPIQQLVHLHTIKLTNAFDSTTDAILANPGKINKIKLINEITVKGLSDAVDAYINKLLETYTIASIDYQYGMSAITELQSASDIDGDNLIKQIQTPEWLLKIATEFAMTYANSNANITDSIKDAFIDKLIDTFKKSISGLSFNTEVSKYHIEQLYVNQFMALGETTIDFTNLSNLIRVNGNNGNGKTTLFRALKWLCTGVIEVWQASNQTKQNAMSLFNDKIDTDELIGTLTFKHIKGNQVIPYRLSRMLNRHWKKNSKDIKNPYWRDNVTKINESVRLERLDTGVIIEDSIEVAAILYDVFGSIWELSRYVCLDQSTLDSIIMMKPDEFNDWLLDQLGINIFAQLNNSYDNIRHDMFENLSKPSKNAETIQAEINTYNEQVAEYKDNLSTKLQEKTVASNNLQDVRISIEKTATTLKQIPANYIASTQLQQELQLLNQTQAQLQLENQSLPNALDESLILNVDKIKSAIDSIETTAQTVHNDILKQSYPLTNQLNDAKLTLQAEQNNQSAFLQGVRTLLTNNVAAAENYIVEKQQFINGVLTSIATSYNTTTQSSIDACILKREELNKIIGNCNVKITSLQAKIDTNAIAIDALESDVCHTCHAPTNVTMTVQYKQALKAEIDESIKELEKTKLILSNASIECNDNTKKMYELQQSMLHIVDYDAIVAKLNDAHKASYNAQCVELQQLKDKHATTVNELNAFNEAADKTKYENASINVKIAEAQKQIFELQNQIDTIQTNATNAYNAKIAEKDTFIVNLQNAELILTEHRQKFDKFTTNTSRISDNAIKIAQLEINIEQAKLYDAWQIENVSINKQLEQLHITENERNLALATLLQEVQSIQLNIDRIDQTIKLLNDSLQAIIDWSIADLVCTAYKTAISKKGLVSLIFAQIANSLNVELNELLANVNYRIFFDINDDNILKMIDLIGEKTIRPIRQMSGMQTTFAALTIVFLIISKRLNKIGNLLLIDEISGKLSNGQIMNADNDINKIDYRAILVQLLHIIAKQRQLLIVDHILDFDEFDSTLTVVMNANGTSTIA